jgi:hypothetical protein
MYLDTFRGQRCAQRSEDWSSCRMGTWWRPSRSGRVPGPLQSTRPSRVAGPGWAAQGPALHAQAQEHLCRGARPRWEGPAGLYPAPSQRRRMCSTPYTTPATASKVTAMLQGNNPQLFISPKSIVIMQLTREK